MSSTTASQVPAAPVVPGPGRLRPLGVDEVRLTGGFWGQRQEVNASVTLPHIADWLERAGWIGNFDLAASGLLPQGRRGREFADSEVYKFLEAAAWELGRRPDPVLEARFRNFVDRVAAAQEPDGYLDTAFGRPGQPPRWSDLGGGHELYCLGHLFQAAVARGRTAPQADDGLLSIACRAADLVCEVFGPDGIQSICGHAEVELGLAELARLTGRRRYLEQARLFIERHGDQTLPEPEWGRSYFQDDLPVREAEVLRGHAVRANYLAAGAVDVAVETGDEELLAALVRQWRRTIARRTYVTGGQGSHHQDEAFGEDWELPPDRAYAETCAAIASTMFGWRLLLATGDLGYADQIERALFNVVATAVADSGDAFFYTNTLHCRVPGEEPDPQAASPRALSSLRAPWFEVSCCPTNIARTLAALPSLLATADADGIQLHQYAAAEIEITLADGTPVGFEILTDYPRSGRVVIRMRHDSPRPWTLTLRVPGWASGAALAYRPATGEAETVAATGATVAWTAAFKAGDELELLLPVESRFLAPDPRIDAVRGCVAVQRGPVVYCAQSPVGGIDLDSVVVDTAVAPRDEGDLVVVAARWATPDEADWPYRTPGSGEPAGGAGVLQLIPYHGWGEDGRCTMRVWLPAR